MNYKLDIIRESVCCFADPLARLSAFVDSHCLDYLLVLLLLRFDFYIVLCVACHVWAGLLQSIAEVSVL